MPFYSPPLKDMQFLLYETFNSLKELKEIPNHQDLDEDTINSILEEAGRFASEVLLPINKIGDLEGCSLNHQTHEVKTPRGFKEAYQLFIKGGWAGLSCDTRFGGQGLPYVINSMFYEMLNSSNQAWAMYPGLTHGAYAALLNSGTEEQKNIYLPKLVSGEWTGTMCLTEPHCGTDLGLMRTKAEPLPDGNFKITGNKIFISSGEHDFTSNIVHLVLARLPDAPLGIKGISLFVVPKYKINPDGTIGNSNQIYCSGLEHKMGINGNATCQMTLDESVGTLVGKANKGMQAMFIMMNAARLGVGNQSVGLSEIAYQNALQYAKERIQMRSLTGIKDKTKLADPIIVHPDVRKMLMTAKAYTEGARALQTFCAVLLEKEHHHPDESIRQESGEILSLITPVAKAFLTDNGHIITNHCMQVFGGHGFIKDWGMEQFARDNRINMIYEGTNTIQSLDLLGRKILSNNGATLKKMGAIVMEFIKEHDTNENMSEFINPLIELSEKINKITMEIGFKSFQNPDELGAASTDYLRIIGHWLFSYFFAKMAHVAQNKIKNGHKDPFYLAKIETAQFYFQKLFPETLSLVHTIRSGSKSLMNTNNALA